MKQEESQVKRAFIIEIISDTRDKELARQKHEELLLLIETHGNIEVVDMFYQHIDPLYKTYIGSGKLQELREDMLNQNVDLLIIGNILKSAQVFNVNEYLRVGESGTEEESHLQAWDQIDLLLKIFDLHAQSSEAKLQIELAAIKHMGPRIFGMGMELSRQWWGIGTSGIWETNTEIMRRHLQNRTMQIKKELKQYSQVRKVHREARKKRHLPTVGLVWYTNAWKSTIMNALTNKWVYVADKLFATLGTDVGQLYVPSMSGKWTTILINDTIGFIRDLPPALLESFRSTLEDSVEAGLLLHVVDAADPLVWDKIRVVDEILDSIWAEQERVVVFNKCDVLPKPITHDIDTDQVDHIHYKEKLKEMAWENAYMFVSAVTWEWLDELKVLLEEKTKWM